MTTFDQLMQDYQWAPINNCHERYRLCAHLQDNLTPQQLLGDGISVYQFDQTTVLDVIFAARFEGGGLISYQRADGKFYHTLNTDSGLARKLQGLQINIAEL